MVFKSTKINITDSCGYLIGKIFHVYKTSSKTYRNSFIYLSIRAVYLKYVNHIGKKSRGFVIRLRKKKHQNDATYINFLKNDCVLLKKRMTTRGKLVKGVILHNNRRRKFITSFNVVL